MITAEYSIAKRPAKHVLVDYNQNAWGRHTGIGLFGASQTACDGINTSRVERG